MAMRYIRYSFRLIVFFFVCIVCVPVYGQALRTAAGLCDTAVVAMVGPLRITVNDFRESYEWGPSFVKKSADPKLHHLQCMIHEKLIALDGRASGVDTAAASKRMLREIEDDAAVAEWYRAAILPRVVMDSMKIERGTEQYSIGVLFRYIYAGNEFDIREVTTLLDHGTPFDSLYRMLQDDPKYLAEESSTNFFTLTEGNADVAAAISHLKPGVCSPVIRARNGFYVVRVDEAKKEFMPTQTRYGAMRAKVATYYRKRQLDSITTSYIRTILEQCPPTISAGALKKVFSFFSHDTLLSIRRTREEQSRGMKRPPGVAGHESLGKEALVTSTCDTITVQEFFAWYSYRNVDIDFSKLTASSVRRMKDLLFKMVRDERLIGIARRNGYASAPLVQGEMRQWKDKLAYWRQKSAAVPQVSFTEDDARKFFAENTHRYGGNGQTGPGGYEHNSEQVKNDLTLFDYNKRLFHYLNSLKQRYPVRIHEATLRSVHVSDERLSQKIDLIIIKKGGTFSRQAFPSIDKEWQYF